MIDEQKIRELIDRKSKMRPSFGMMMKEILKERSDVVLTVADSAKACRLNVTDDIKNNFVDCGIAEQDMTSVAAGLACGGMKVVTFAFAPFATERCFEQIRLDLAYADLGVVVVGGDAGVGNGTQGVTHYGWEDIAVMRSLPNMTVVCPADHLEMYKCMEQALKMDSPIYIRLTGGIPRPVYTRDYRFEIGEAITLREGKDAYIISMGTLLPNVLDAAKLLEKQGLSVGVVNMHTVKPIDVECIRRLARKVPAILTVEEHSIINNGLGSAVADTLMEEDLHVSLKKIGLPDAYPHEVSPYLDMLKDYGLTAEAIAAQAEKYISKQAVKKA